MAYMFSVLRCPGLILFCDRFAFRISFALMSQTSQMLSPEHNSTLKILDAWKMSHLHASGLNDGFNVRNFITSKVHEVKVRERIHQND